MQTVELAKKAKSSGVGHFIFMSTVKVYGENQGQKIRVRDLLLLHISKEKLLKLAEPLKKNQYEQYLIRRAEQGKL